MAAGRVQAQSHQVTAPEAIAYAPQQPLIMLFASRAGTELPRYALAPLTARPTVTFFTRTENPKCIHRSFYVESTVG